MSNWQPFCLQKDFPDKTPVCASCKKTNRTRSFCRERHKHRQLPWCTVYVILSAVDVTDPSTVVAAPSHLNDNEDKVSTFSSNVADDSKANGVTPENTAEQEVDLDETDDIHKIEESRTFLAQVSCKSNVINWLQHMEGETVTTTSESDVKALNDAIRTPSIHPDMHHTAMPAQAYYPMMSPQQQQHYFQQQQQQFAAWHAQYGQHMMMPPPMMPIAPMGGHPPPPGVVEAESSLKNDAENGNGQTIPEDGSNDNATAPEGTSNTDNNAKKNEFEVSPTPTSVSLHTMSLFPPARTTVTTML